jgi:hypothetical protein
MYWYRAKLKVAAVLASSVVVVACWSACKPDVKESGASLKYFDIDGYFTKNIARLNKLNKPVLKTVTHNTASESKTVHISDWGLELSLFKDADINRPAWKNSYTMLDEDGLVVYRAKYPELKMRQMLIKKENGKVKWIIIYNKTPKNILYQTIEKLTFFPDSLYIIDKVQRVRLLGANTYEIKGAISK